MPQFNNNGLDDPLLVDANASFSGGQVSYGPPDQLPQLAAQYLTNVDHKDGTATTRRGSEKLGDSLPDRVQGMFWFDTPAFEYLVAVSGGQLYRYTGGDWELWSSYGTSNTSGQICMCQLVDQLYIADGLDLYEWDGTTLTDITSAPPGRFIITATAAVWSAGDPANPDTLSRSPLLDGGGTWDSTNQSIRIGGGEGDPITGLVEWDDYKVVVFKRNSIYIVTADPRTTAGTTATTNLTNAVVTKVAETIGCVSHRSIARVGNDVFFLSDDGVFSLGRMIADNQREIKQASSFPIQDIIERINWTNADRAAATFWDNRYLLSLPLDDDADPSSVIVYNTQRNSWAGEWTGWEPICWALERPSGVPRVAFGRPDGAVREWLEYVRPENEVDTTYQDDGENIATFISTRGMIFSDALSPKSLLNVQVEFYDSSAQATVGVSLDEDEAEILKSDFDTSSGVLLLPFVLPQLLPNKSVKRRAFGCQHLSQFRSAQVEVRSDAGKLALRAVIATAFINTIRLEI